MNHTVALSLSKGAYRLDTLRQAQGYGIIKAIPSKVIPLKSDKGDSFNAKVRLLCRFMVRPVTIHLVHMPRDMHKIMT